MTPPDPHHHPSHRRLLSHLEKRDTPGAGIDAVIVPISRAVRRLAEAAQLAAALDAPLLALCSGAADPTEALRLTEAADVDLVAVDSTGVEQILPRFGSDDLLQLKKLGHPSDTSLKRNLALALATSVGWERVLFLDDDISGVQIDDVRTAAWFLGQHPVIGLDNDGFPDNSVVCHAYREVMDGQETFIGAGALVLAPGEVRSFFPNIYNEDWFFLLGARPGVSAGVTGTVRQSWYDPFADPGRARREELGDCLAEGLFWLLDQGKQIDEADAEFWRDFLARRQRLIEKILRDLAPQHPCRARIARSLHAALAVHSLIEPGLCLDYLRHWHADLGRWGRHLAELPRFVSLDKALAELGLGSRVYRPDRAGRGRARPAHTVVLGGTRDRWAPVPA